jgi:regulation of enolase protein 1 (concanavalin A-like superfamily)
MIRFGDRISWFYRSHRAALVLALGVLIARPAVGQGVVFRDDFDSTTLSAGWTFVRESPSRHSLTARPGFWRVQTQRGAPVEGGDVRNILLRDASGTFILDTRLEFNPQVAQQFAGIVIYQDDGHATAIGLAHAAGDRGRFRGVVLLGLGDFDEANTPRPAAFYDESTVDSPNVVYLRLLRSGDQFVGAFSEDGTNFIDVGTVTNLLMDEVRVGLVATNGDFPDCGTACDQSIPADFDYFQITQLDDDGPIIVPTLESVTVNGPDEVRSGGSAVFTAEAEFADGSTAGVTGQADWMIAPPGLAQMDGGLLVAGTVDATRQITVVATYTQTTSTGTVTATGTTLLRIEPQATGGNPSPSMCGVGMIAMLPLLLAGLAGLRGHGRGAGCRR